MGAQNRSRKIIIGKDGQSLVSIYLRDRRERDSPVESRKKSSMVDDTREPISGARTSMPGLLCNINIYDSFTKLI